MRAQHRCVAPAQSNPCLGTAGKAQEHRAKSTKPAAGTNVGGRVAMCPLIKQMDRPVTLGLSWRLVISDFSFWEAFLSPAHLTQPRISTGSGAQPELPCAKSEMIFWDASGRDRIVGKWNPRILRRLEETLKIISFHLLLWAGTPFPIPGCSKPRPSSPWTLPGTEIALG